MRSEFFIRFESSCDTPLHTHPVGEHIDLDPWLASMDSSWYSLSFHLDCFFNTICKRVDVNQVYKREHGVRLFLDSSIGCSNTRHTDRACFQRSKAEVFLGMGWGDHPFGFTGVAVPQIRLQTQVKIHLVSLFSES